MAINSFTDLIELEEFQAPRSFSRGLRPAALADFRAHNHNWPPTKTRAPTLRNESPERTRMAQQELSETERAELRRQIERLREEHRDLDAAIEALNNAGAADRLQMQRIKKRKLALRDRLAQLEDLSTPDIIA
jgi:hypothetical protein